MMEVLFLALLRTQIMTERGQQISLPILVQRMILLGMSQLFL